MRETGFTFHLSFCDLHSPPYDKFRITSKMFLCSQKSISFATSNSLHTNLLMGSPVPTLTMVLLITLYNSAPNSLFNKKNTCWFFFFFFPFPVLWNICMLENLDTVHCHIAWHGVQWSALLAQFVWDRISKTPIMCSTFRSTCCRGWAYEEILYSGYVFLLWIKSMLYI